jgi:hypothetical protein
MDDDDEFQISYEGVPLGVPVLTRDGEQFGLLEHVMAVEEEDIFEGIVVWSGGGAWVDRKIQLELSRGHQSASQFLERFQHHKLRFVEADKVAMITVGWIRCDLDLAEVGLLQPPSQSPVLHAQFLDQQGDGVWLDSQGHQGYRRVFDRGRSGGTFIPPVV